MVNKVKIDGETIYLKKSKRFGWGIIHPLKNEDGSINLKNLLAGGSWLKLIILGIIIFLILNCVSEYSNTLRIANECLKLNQLVIIP